MAGTKTQPFPAPDDDADDLDPHSVAEREADKADMHAAADRINAANTQRRNAMGMLDDRAEGAKKRRELKRSGTRLRDVTP